MKSTTGSPLKTRTLLKPVLCIALSLAGSATSEAIAADDRQQASDIVIQSQSTGSFKSLLYSLWGRLQAMNPRDEVSRTPGTSIATLGVRGARMPGVGAKPGSEGTAMDDLPVDEAYHSYMTAQQYVQAGDLDRAVVELETLIDGHPDSELVPMARFTLGMSQASLGDNHAGKWTMIEFIDDYPDHPLAADANKVLEEFEVIELLE